MAAPCSPRLQLQLHLCRAIRVPIRARSHSLPATANAVKILRQDCYSNSNNCQRQQTTQILSLSLLFRRSYTTQSKNSITDDLQQRDDDDDDDGGDSSHLLMRATAQQLKGDVPEAIALTSRAVLIMKRKLKTKAKSNMKADDEAEDIADALLFLGKLYQLQGAFGDAVEPFSEARILYQQLLQQQQQQFTTETPTVHQSKRKELTALSHLASAQSRWLAGGSSGSSPNTDTKITEVDADELFREALEGLEETCGWEDGMTNHTAHEWSLVCRLNGNPRNALSILTNMKEKLSGIFGTNDHRVLQLNGELAELWQLVSALPSSSNHNDSSSSDERNRNLGDGSDTSAAATTAEENAMALLEEALDNLPPNSPEARRIFMQLEEWKEQQQQQNEQQQNQHLQHHHARGGTTATTVGGVAVTFTKGRG